MAREGAFLTPFVLLKQKFSRQNGLSKEEIPLFSFVPKMVTYKIKEPGRFRASGGHPFVFRRLVAVSCVAEEAKRTVDSFLKV